MKQKNELFAVKSSNIIHTSKLNSVARVSLLLITWCIKLCLLKSLLSLNTYPLSLKPYSFIIYYFNLFHIHCWYTDPTHCCKLTFVSFIIVKQSLLIRCRIVLSWKKKRVLTLLLLKKVLVSDIYFKFFLYLIKNWIVIFFKSFRSIKKVYC